MSDKPKRKEKPKHRTRRYLLVFAFIGGLMLSVLISLALIIDLPDPDWDLALTATSIVATNRAVEEAMYATSTAEANSMNAQTVEMTATENCFFAWSYRPNEEMASQIEEALTPTGLEFNRIGVVHNGEGYCDRYSVYDTTFTIDVTIPRGEVTETLEAIIELLPDLDTNNAIYLNLGFEYDDGDEPAFSSFRTLYSDIRRAYAEGLRGEALLEMGR